MQITRRLLGSPRLRAAGVIVAILAMGIASCRSTHNPRVTKLQDGWPKGHAAFQQTSFVMRKVAIPQVPEAEYVDDVELCMMCHEAYANYMEKNVHRGLREGQSCEACHGPASRHLETRGKEPGLILSFKTLSAREKSAICMKCHEEDDCSPGAQFRASRHAQKGVACTDCHTAHYNVPPGTPATSELAESEDPLKGRPSIKQTHLEEQESQPSLRGTSNALGAVAPNVCYQCHDEMVVFEQLAGPHQIGGPNGFNCTTCHDPHGRLVEEARTDLCMECHKSESPTTAFHSSTHAMEGVACTDCHNPHPTVEVPRFVNIRHESVHRPKRLPMSVNEPDVCYECHQKIFALTALPSHHPLKEWRIHCSDCHDLHGQNESDLVDISVNAVCYKCHAEKEGPFVFEHPPASENCSYCHEPHGTVANNLLRQPPVFLCLRCHTGHRSGVYDTDGSFDMQRNLYSDCTDCHKQIHGSDLPSQTGNLGSGTRGHRLTR